MSDYYLESLSLQEEIPRLAAVSRITHLAVSAFLDENPPPERIDGDCNFLDLACGPGILTGLIANHFHSYTMHGIDRSKGLIQFAEISYPKINWIEGDLRDLPYDSNSIDYMMIHFALVHIHDMEKVLEEIRRVLKPGGQFLVIEPDLLNSDVDPLVLELFRQHESITKGNLDCLKFLENNLDRLEFEMIHKELFQITSSGKENDPPKLNQSTIHLGRMAIWSIFSYMGQLLQLREIYNECVEKYMSKQISIRSLKLPILLLQKK